MITNIVGIYLIIVVVGYLLGSINTSILVGKFYKIDVRDHGSKNAGLTNSLRTMGKFAAVLVILGDVLKSVASCMIGKYLLPEADILGIMLGGIACVVGHNWPVYFRFKGGKGILSTFSVILIANWKIGLILFGIFLVIVLTTRYVSLGSVIATIMFPSISFLLKEDKVFIICATLLSLIALIRHIPNIKRLVNGTESKLGQKAKLEVSK